MSKLRESHPGTNVVRWTQDDYHGLAAVFELVKPDYRVGGAKFSGAGFLPSEFGPFSLGADPAAADFRVRDLSLTADLCEFVSICGCCRRLHYEA